MLSQKPKPYVPRYADRLHLRISRVLNIALFEFNLADKGGTEADGVVDTAEAEHDAAGLESV